MRKHLTFLIILLFLCTFFQNLYSDFTPEEKFMFPLGMVNADILPKGEFDFSIYPPGYFFYGVTPRLTIGWDWWGMFLKIPAFDFKYLIIKESNQYPGLTFDFYFFILPDFIDDMQKVESDFDDLYLGAEGTKHCLRLNFVKSFNKRFRLHLSIGYASGEYLELKSVDESGNIIIDQKFENYYLPILNLGFEYIFSNKIIGILYWSKGDTISNYLDQVVEKQQIGIGIVSAPFSSKNLWLNKLRLELGLIHYNLYNLKLEMLLPILALKLKF